MKICLYTPIFYPYIGGIQTVVFLLANEFVKFGHDVTVVTEKKNNLKATKMNNEYLRKYLFRFIITKSIFQTKKILSISISEAHKFKHDFFLKLHENLKEPMT